MRHCAQDGGDLSRASMAKLDDIFAEYGHEDPFDVVSETHEFTEWQEYYRVGTSTPIPLEAILHAQGADTMLRQVETKCNYMLTRKLFRRRADISPLVSHLSSIP